MEQSIFTKIINGDIPCHKVYEDERVFAFLDIHPVSPGHTLVVPKQQVPFVWDTSDEVYMALMKVCKVIALRQRQVLQVPYVGTQIVGIDVPHAHVHLIPFSTVGEFYYRPDVNQEPNHKELERLAQLLVSSK